MSEYYEFAYITNKGYYKRVLVRVVIVCIVMLILGFLVWFVLVKYHHYQQAIMFEYIVVSSLEGEHDDNEEILQKSTNSINNQGVPQNVDSLGPGEYFQSEVLREGQTYVKYTYRIKEGDVLWKIAQKFLHDAYYWDEIVKTNKEIVDPHIIRQDDILFIYLLKKNVKEVDGQ